MRHPAFQAGYEAFMKGELANPHFKHSIAAKEFEAGQNSAYFNNLKQIKEDKYYG